MVKFEAPLEISVDSGMEKEKTWQELDSDINKIVQQGFGIRAIVVEKNLAEYQRADPGNWGVVTRIDRYQSSTSSTFKPLVCHFFNRVSSKSEYLSPNDVFLVYPAKGHQEVLDSIKEQQRAT